MAGVRGNDVVAERPPVTWPALAFRDMASRCRALSRSNSSAKAVKDSMILSVGKSSVRSLSTR
jgi:hypothetical protein